jgi:hypothetical protein
LITNLTRSGSLDIQSRCEDEIVSAYVQHTVRCVLFKRISGAVKYDKLPGTARYIQHSTQGQFISKLTRPPSEAPGAHQSVDMASEPPPVADLADAQDEVGFSSVRALG